MPGLDGDQRQEPTGPSVRRIAPGSVGEQQRRCPPNDSQDHRRDEQGEKAHHRSLVLGELAASGSEEAESGGDAGEERKRRESEAGHGPLRRREGGKGVPGHHQTARRHDEQREGHDQPPEPGVPVRRPLAQGGQ